MDLSCRLDMEWTHSEGDGPSVRNVGEAVPGAGEELAQDKDEAEDGALPREGGDECHDDEK